VKCLMERLQQICNELKDENELNIMKEYGNNVKRYTTVFILFAMSCIFMAISMQILWVIFDIVLQTNGSHSRQLLHVMISESFISEEKYYHLILLYTNIVMCIGATTLTAIGTMLRGCLTYACGMFKIARYSEFVLSSFEGSFLALTATSVFCLSLNLFAIFHSVSIGNKEGFLFHVLIVLAIFVYMFIANYTGQEIMDHNNYIYITAYNVRWYVAPVNTQKLILFILQRSSKTVALNFGNVFVVSLECFATVKCLLEQLQHIYNEIKDENEIAIIEKYGLNAKRYTIRIIQVTLCCALALVFVPMWPCVLDIVMPAINESRPRFVIPIMTEYFVDQEKYFYLILLHIDIAICIGAIAYIATGTMLVGYLKHACGMFKIASYRIERAIIINIFKNDTKNEITIYKAIIYAVDIHRKAIKLALIRKYIYTYVYQFIIIKKCFNSKTISFYNYYLYINISFFVS
ncbi:hypothetical protein ALC62_08868, partial [Cyphomyrmex costatus]